MILTESESFMVHINILNSKLLLSIEDKYPIGLFDGKMGICIYFYYLSRWEEIEVHGILKQIRK